MSIVIRKQTIHRQGFTLIELIVAIFIFGILCSIAVPAFSSWIPEYNLKMAVRDLYSNMQLTRTLSIKKNAKYQIVFNTAGRGYRVVRPDGTTEKTVAFTTYDKGGGIGYGSGNATEEANGSGDPVQEDGVSFQFNKTTFNSKGIGSLGYVYLANNKGTAYAIGSRITGFIVIKKWKESAGKWE